MQTLSRGNRIHPHKHDTFVLDFINDVETIEQAYSQYLGEASAPDVDPQAMYETWAEQVSLLDGRACLGQGDPASWGTSPTAISFRNGQL